MTFVVKIILFIKKKRSLGLITAKLGFVFDTELQRVLVVMNFCEIPLRDFVETVSNWLTFPSKPRHFSHLEHLCLASMGTYVVEQLAFQLQLCSRRCVSAIWSGYDSRVDNESFCWLIKTDDAL